MIQTIGAVAFIILFIVVSIALPSWIEGAWTFESLSKVTLVDVLTYAAIASGALAFALLFALMKDWLLRRKDVQFGRQPKPQGSLYLFLFILLALPLSLGTAAVLLSR